MTPVEEALYELTVVQRDRALRELAHARDDARVEAAACDIAEARLAKVFELVQQARKVSPSDSMTLYVRDVEIALGLYVGDAPHKLGQEGR